MPGAPPRVPARPTLVGLLLHPDVLSVLIISFRMFLSPALALAPDFCLSS